MILNSLKLSNIRNHLSADYKLELETIFIGENGIGKSSVLESIYFLLALRGFKRQPLSSLISFGEDFLRIDGSVTDVNSPDTNLVLKYDGKRVLLADDNIIENLSSYLYSNPIAAYTPDHLGVLSVLQPDRRAFIDRFIFYTDISHIDDIRLFKRLIQQKNTEFEKLSVDKIYIDIINEKIVELSERIYIKRFNIITEINLLLKKYYATVFKNIDHYYLSYESNVKRTDIFEREFINLRSIYGVHRDRLFMFNDDNSIEKFSSFGQKKTFALLVLLALITYVETINTERSIVLLDDFEAGLDINRAEVLRELFSDNRQTVYSGVDAVRIKYKNIVDLKR